MFALIAISLLLGAGGTAPVDPNANCMACHIMRPKLDSLRAGNHAKVASCSDCHEPHGNLVLRLYSVASDGIRHALITTLQATPPVIRIHRAGAEVVQANCIRCHGTEAERSAPANAKLPRPMPQPKTSAHANSTRMCAECHSDTSHPRLQRRTDGEVSNP